MSIDGEPRIAGLRLLRAREFLAQHPDAPLRDRATMALVIVTGGNRSGGKNPTYGELADVLGEDVNDVKDALESLLRREGNDGD